MSINWDAVVVGPVVKQFGDANNYMPKVGAAFGIGGVFDNAYRTVTSATDGSEIASVYPVLGVQLSQFLSPPVQGDHVFIAENSKTYVVRNIKPDSHGWALLALSYVSG